jgi:hypothetical protein
MSKKHIKPVLFTAMATTACLSASAPAFADAVFHYDANASYTSADDSPFNSTFSGVTWWLEDFEDGLLNSLGLSANAGSVKGPSKGTDSVDGDDGEIDGFGSMGSSYKLNASAPAATFKFDDAVLGAAPTIVGFAWTDGHEDAVVTVKAWDTNGDFLGKFMTTLGDGNHNGETDADRLFCVEWAEGISRIKVSASQGFVEMDHFQYGFAGDDNGPPVVPLPAPLALGLAGLGIVGVARRCRKAKKA